MSSPHTRPLSRMQRPAGPESYHSYHETHSHRTGRISESSGMKQGEISEGRQPPRRPYRHMPVFFDGCRLPRPHGMAPEPTHATVGLASQPISDQLWTGVYYDKGLSSYGPVGTDIALRHWANASGSVIEEQLARDAEVVNSRGRLLGNTGYQIPRPRSRRVNGINVSPEIFNQQLHQPAPRRRHAFSWIQDEYRQELYNEHVTPPGTQSIAPFGFRSIHNHHYPQSGFDLGAYRKERSTYEDRTRNSRAHREPDEAAWRPNRDPSRRSDQIQLPRPQDIADGLYLPKIQEDRGKKYGNHHRLPPLERAVSGSHGGRAYQLSNERVPERNRVIPRRMPGSWRNTPSIEERGGSNNSHRKHLEQDLRCIKRYLENFDEGELSRQSAPHAPTPMNKDLRGYKIGRQTDLAEKQIAKPNGPRVMKKQRTEDYRYAGEQMRSNSRNSSGSTTTVSGSTIKSSPPTSINSTLAERNDIKRHRDTVTS